MINANERSKVLSSNTMWCCVSCYLCTTRCPQSIPITDIMYCLKRMAIREGLAKDTDAPALAKTFTEPAGPVRPQLRARAGQPLLPASTSRWRC